MTRPRIETGTSRNQVCMCVTSLCFYNWTWNETQLSRAASDIVRHHRKEWHLTGWTEINPRSYVIADPMTSESRWKPVEVNVYLPA